MADSTPLLPPPPQSLDEAFELYMGDFGGVQLLQAFLVSFAWVFDAQQTFISVFTDAEPSWHCTTTQLGSGSDAELCASVSDVCHLPNGSWAWDRAIDTSIISEWNLACAASSVIKSLPASSFFMGCMVGGIVLASLADSSLGRKNMLFLSCFFMSATGILTIFSPNVWIYSGLRFLTGFGRATIGTCAIVLSTELVGKRWRGQVGVIGFLLFTVGFLTLPVIAYLNRDSSWRYLYLWTSVPALLYCFLVLCFVRESPRWLLVRGRKEEAMATLKSIVGAAGAAAVNNIDSSSSGLMAFVEEKETSTSLNLWSLISILVEKRWALRRLCAIMTVGFGVGMVYYGLPLALGNLPFNLYWNVTFNALSELPASLIAFMFIERMNRKSSVVGFTMASGVCSLMCVVIMGHDDEKEEWAVSVVKMGLELVSFFSTITAFEILLIYTIELFPTSIRNSAMAMVRQALVFGGVLCPVIVEMGRGRGYLSYGIFGVVIISCGLFAGCLPETRGGRLCDTMEEEENRHQLMRAAVGSA